MVVPLTIQAGRGSSQDIFAATRVVDPSGLNGTDTTIAAALAALPAAGGVIFVREGTFAETLTMPDKPVKILGAGRGLTIIDLASVASAVAFGMAFDRPYTFCDFTITGDSTAALAQKGFEYTGPSPKLQPISIERVDSGLDFSGETDGVETYFNVTAAKIVNDLSIRDCVAVCGSTTTTSGAILDGFGSSSHIRLEAVIGKLNAHLDTAAAVITATDCVFTDKSGGDAEVGVESQLVNCTFAGNMTVRPSASGRVMFSNCFFRNEPTTAGRPQLEIPSAAGGGSVVSACVFRRFVGSSPAFTLTVANDSIVIGCNFGGAAVTGQISVTGVDNVIAHNVNNASNPGLIESGGADRNRLSENIGFTLTIIGPDSIVNDSRKRGVTAGATTAAFVNQFTHTNPKGLVGIGTIKNTGGVNALEVREDVTDAFGTVTTVTTTVLFGDDYLLDPQTNFGTARPPYVSYGVFVRHPVAATTFDLQFTGRGVE